MFVCFESVRGKRHATRAMLLRNVVGRVGQSREHNYTRISLISHAYPPLPELSSSEYIVLLWHRLTFFYSFIRHLRLKLIKVNNNVKTTVIEGKSRSPSGMAVKHCFGRTNKICLLVEPPGSLSSSELGSYR